MLSVRTTVGRFVAALATFNLLVAPALQIGHERQMPMAAHCAGADAGKHRSSSTPHHSGDCCDWCCMAGASLALVPSAHPGVSVTVRGVTVATWAAVTAAPGRIAYLHPMPHAPPRTTA
jgi:hypothetical protein